MKVKAVTELTRRFAGRLHVIHLPKRAVAIRGVSSNTSRLGPGYLFMALAGARMHGSRYLLEAAAKGARVFILQEPFSRAHTLELLIRYIEADIAVFAISGDKALPTAIADWVYDEPTRRIGVVAVTGTNGKTTVTYMLEAIARAAGVRYGVIGTINNRYGKTITGSTLTTPQSDEILYLLDAMATAGCRYAFIEATSQALDLGRLDAVYPRAVAFTNLTRDHLDCHKTMRAYFRAKSSTVTRLLNHSRAKDRFCVANLDDKRGARFLRLAGRGVKRIGFSIVRSCALRASDIKQSLMGLEFTVGDTRNNHHMSLKLYGSHNVSNALTAIAVARQLGFSWAHIVKGLAALETVEGRLDRVREFVDRLVLIDYAHTPDALMNVLCALKAIQGVGSIIVVFGCGGDRDPGKRPIMGRLAASLADLCVITSDNPRSEDPQAIIADIEAGSKSVKRALYVKIPDRTQAIRWAIRASKPGDCVLVAGKGHEKYQIFKDRTMPFDDKQVCRSFAKLI